MRNAYPGTCYRCGERVEAGAGHFERHGRAWRTQHAECAIMYRGHPECVGGVPRPASLEIAKAVVAKRST